MKFLYQIICWVYKKVCETDENVSYLFPSRVVFIQESLNASAVIGVNGHQVLHLQKKIKNPSEIKHIFFQECLHDPQ